MADITFEDVLELAEQLSQEEQARLIEELQLKRQNPKRQPLRFPVDNLGPWPEGFSLRRKDWYGDER